MSPFAVLVVLAACGSDPAKQPTLPDATPAIDAAPFTTLGTLDPSFGTNGIATYDLGGADYPTSMAIEPSGRIVVAARNLTNATFALVGFTATGALDTAFGTSGTVAITESSTVVSTDSALFVIPQLLCGCARRYHFDGTLDTTYGSNGLGTLSVMISIQSGRYVLAVDSTGRVIYVFIDGNNNAVVTRLTANGTSDFTFGTSGVATLPAVDQLGAITAAPDDSLFVALFPSNTAASVVHVTASGAIDSAYAAPPLTSNTAATVAISLDSTERAVMLARGPQQTSPGAYVFRLAANGAVDEQPLLVDDGTAGDTAPFAITVHALPDGSAAVLGTNGVANLGYAARIDANWGHETLWPSSGAAFDLAVSGQAIYVVGSTGPFGLATNDIQITKLR